MPTELSKQTLFNLSRWWFLKKEPKNKPRKCSSQGKPKQLRYYQSNGKWYDNLNRYIKGFGERMII